MRDVIALDIGARVDQIEITDLAFNGQCPVYEVVIDVVGREMLELQVAQRYAENGRGEGAEALPLGLLPHEQRGNRPVVVEIDLEGRSRAPDRDVVEVVLRKASVVDRNAELRERAVRKDVIDVAAATLVPPDQSHCGALRQRDVHESLYEATRIAMAYQTTLDLVGGLEGARIGLVGDDPQRACLGTGTVQSALRPGQRLDARDVVQVHVYGALDGRDGLLVQVGAHSR